MGCAEIIQALAVEPHPHYVLYTANGLHHVWLDQRTCFDDLSVILTECERVGEPIRAIRLRWRESGKWVYRIVWLSEGWGIRNDSKRAVEHPSFQVSGFELDRLVSLRGFDLDRLAFLYGVRRYAGHTDPYSGRRVRGESDAALRRRILNQIGPVIPPVPPPDPEE